MSKFYGGSYLRPDIDTMDKGALQAAVYRYVETGNADELKDLLNQDWAKTKVGQGIIEDMLEVARKEVAGRNAKAKRQKEQDDSDPYVAFRDLGVL